MFFFPPQFVCIAQQDYCCILNQVEKNMQKVEEEGEIVMVKEHRELDRTGTRKGHIVIKVRIWERLWFDVSLKKKIIQCLLFTKPCLDLNWVKFIYVFDCILDKIDNL